VAQREEEFETQLGEGLEGARRAESLVNQIPEQFARDASVQVAASNLLASLFNLIGAQLRHFLVLKKTGTFLQATGAPF
jgi:hypothetical protein